MGSFKSEPVLREVHPYTLCEMGVSDVLETLPRNVLVAVVLGESVPGIPHKENMYGKKKDCHPYQAPMPCG
jgi:hypothetical protein